LRGHVAVVDGSLKRPPNEAAARSIIGARRFIDLLRERRGEVNAKYSLHEKLYLELKAPRDKADFFLP
jgi:hypothetical protein